MAATLSREDARLRMIHHSGLARPTGRGSRAIVNLLDRLRCIQLDPLDAIGTNADLVVMARVGDACKGDVYSALFPRHAFEHFAKERCIIPVDAFPWYRAAGHLAQAPWWRHGERVEKVPDRLVQAVLKEVRARGPVTAKDLTDHGRVEAMDWSGWKGTGRATSMALEILWTQCDVVVAGRLPNGAKLYDVPERAFGRELPPVRCTREEFLQWALLERVIAAGLLSPSASATWSMLRPAKDAGTVKTLLEEGSIVEVTVEGSARRYLCTPAFLSRRTVEPDGEVRILGPLDPLIWDRDLIRAVFGFDYVWEVYKPAPQRKWGWYVCPLLAGDRFVGRIDASSSAGRMAVRKLWLEPGADEAAVRAALEKHATKIRCDLAPLKKRSIIYAKNV